MGIKYYSQLTVPNGAPVDVRAEAKSSTELVVTWEPPPRETWNGNLLGYHVGFAEGTGDSNNIHSYTFRSVEVRQHYGGEATLQSLSKFTTYNIIVQVRVLFNFFVDELNVQTSSINISILLSNFYRLIIVEDLDQQVNQ